MVFLDPREYAKIVSEINTNYEKYRGKRIAIHLSFGFDNNAYAYIFENKGFNKYIFISRDLIE
ncbi:hypothetical protein SAMN04487760_10489 [Lachnospiraceae bacterium G41]|nr:hypothetical protein SAMN04487760_10489 [Lachnospiraceae bacterium G41]